MRFVGTAIVIESGDHLTAIARQLGSTWRALYEAPENESFRLKRPNPNRVLVGDVVQMPADVARRVTMRWLAGQL